MPERIFAVNQPLFLEGLWLPSFPKKPRTTFAPVDYRTEPSRYKHWRLSFDGARSPH